MKPTPVSDGSKDKPVVESELRKEGEKISPSAQSVESEGANHPSTPLPGAQPVKEFFRRAIAFHRKSHPKPFTAPRKPNKRTKGLPPESDHELIWRLLNKAIGLMDVPEARQDAQWWADRDEVLFGWDKLLRGLSPLTFSPGAGLQEEIAELKKANRNLYIESNERLARLDKAEAALRDIKNRTKPFQDEGQWFFSNSVDKTVHEIASAALSPDTAASKKDSGSQTLST